MQHVLLLILFQFLQTYHQVLTFSGLFSLVLTGGKIGKKEKLHKDRLSNNYISNYTGNNEDRAKYININIRTLFLNTAQWNTLLKIGTRSYLCSHFEDLENTKLWTLYTDWENLIERNPELKVNLKFMNVRFYNHV